MAKIDTIPPGVDTAKNRWFGLGLRTGRVEDARCVSLPTPGAAVVSWAREAKWFGDFSHFAFTFDGMTIALLGG